MARIRISALTEVALDGTSFVPVVQGSVTYKARITALPTGSNDNAILRADGTGGYKGQSSAVGIDDSGNIAPIATDGGALGTTALRWSDAFLATGANINIAGDWIATHSAGILTVGTGDLRVTTAGANSASVVTVGGAQTLTGKTLTSPIIAGSPTAAASTWANLGIVTTADINGGTIDGVVIGGSSAAAIAGTVITGNSFVPNLSSVPTNGLYLPAANTLGWAVNSAAEMQLTATALSPAVDGGNSLGTTALAWQNLFGNTGFVLNIEAGNWVATHTTGILTVGTGDLRITTAGVNTASIVTVGGTQTLTAKQLTTATVNTSFTPTANDGAALGSTALSFSDAFLASGAVLNFNSGNITITHAAGALAFGGTSGVAVTMTYSGADGIQPLIIDATASAIDISPGFTIKMPATGAQKAFQCTSSGAISSWASFEFGVGGAGKPGLALGPGSGGRDTILYRDAADVLKTDDTFALATGTTALAPLKFTSGTNLTTAAAGAIEFDGTALYQTAVASSRQVVNAAQFATVQGTDVSLTNNITTAQNVFAAANDVLSLAASTTYMFELFFVVATGATTHTTALGLVASSAFTSIRYLAELWSTTSGTISTTAPSVLDVISSAATVLNATSTATLTTIRARGIIRTNAASTITPQITFSAGPTGTCAVKTDSWFRIWPVGSNTVAFIGNWA